MVKIVSRVSGVDTASQHSVFMLLSTNGNVDYAFLVVILSRGKEQQSQNK